MVFKLDQLFERAKLKTLIFEHVTDSHAQSLVRSQIQAVLNQSAKNLKRKANCFRAPGFGRLARRSRRPR